MAYKQSMHKGEDSDPDFSSNATVIAVTYQIRFTTVPGDGEWDALVTYFLEKRKFMMNQNDIS